MADADTRQEAEAEPGLHFDVSTGLKRVLGSVGIHREFITAAARWIMEAKL